MLSELSAAVLAKAKVAALITASLAAGGVGGAVALSHVAPSSHLVRDTAATVEPTTADTPDGTVETQDPVTDATPDPEPSASDATTYTLPDCPADVKNHGAYVSSVAKSAPKGKDGAHGDWVSQAAKGDCGKPAATAADDHGTDAPDADTDTDAPDNDTADADTDTGTTDGADDTQPTAVKPTHDHSDHGASSWSHGDHGGNDKS